jgi:hypothetical protein
LQSLKLEEQFMPVRSVRLSVIAAISGAIFSSTFAVHAASLAATAEALRQISPETRERMPVKLREKLERPAMRSALEQADDDVAEPVLIAFDVAPSVDVTVSGAGVLVSFKSADDLSGVRYGYAFATGPGGHTVDVGFNESLPTKKVAGKMINYATLSPFLEPGIYKFTSAFLWDTAGNLGYYDAEALATLGRTTFTLKNSKGFDRTAPNLQLGKILTQTVTASGTHPGTNEIPFIGLSVTAMDRGDSATAGVASVRASFCLLDQSQCINAWGATNERGAGSVTIKLGGQLFGNPAPGEYHLYTLSVEDAASIEQHYMSSAFGGETDFSLYFPSTTINILP